MAGAIGPFVGTIQAILGSGNVTIRHIDAALLIFLEIYQSTLQQCRMIM